MSDASLISYIFGAVGVVVAALTTAVTVLYKQQISNLQATIVEIKTENIALKLASELKITELEKRADMCEEQRAELAIAHARLEERVSNVERTKQNRDSVG